MSADEQMIQDFPGLIKELEDIALERIAHNDERIAEYLCMVYKELLGYMEDKTAFPESFKNLEITDLTIKDFREMALRLSKRTGIPYTKKLKNQPTLYRWYIMFWPEIKDHIKDVYNELKHGYKDDENKEHEKNDD